MGCFPDKDGKTHCCKVATEKLCTSKTCIPKNTVCCKNGSYVSSVPRLKLAVDDGLMDMNSVRQDRIV